MEEVLLRTGGTFVPCVVFWDHRSFIHFRFLFVEPILRSPSGTTRKFLPCHLVRVSHVYPTVVWLVIGVGSPSAFANVYGFKGLRLCRCVRYVLQITIWSCRDDVLSELHSVVLARMDCVLRLQVACEILSSGNVR